ncbi:MAG: hypothetical protein SFZ23_06515 [Planctomycetota bacterium]|nr:hypothetical protein [Planctomycetota bacterium]
MNFEAARGAQEIAFNHMKARTPLDVAATEVVRFVKPLLPAEIDLSFVPGIMEETVQVLQELITTVFEGEPPKKSINGLYFGLAELIFDDEDSDGEGDGEEAGDDESDLDSMGDGPVVTLHVTGSTAFDLEGSDPEWACDASWNPDNCYTPCPLHVQLSTLRPLPPDESPEDGSDGPEFDTMWLITAGLIEPLNILLVGEVVRRLWPVLLGKAPYRGIATGLDEGEMIQLGVLYPDGFRPAESLPPSELGDEEI